MVFVPVLVKVVIKEITMLMVNDIKIGVGT